MKNDIQQKLQALQDAYIKNLPSKLAAIEKDWQGLTLNFNKQDFAKFHRDVHTLCGSSGTYGFLTLSQAVRDLEVYLKQLLDNSDLNTTQRSEISHLVHKINEVLYTQEEKFSASLKPLEKNVESKLIYLIDNEDAFKDELKNDLLQIGYQLILIKYAADFLAIAKEHAPAAIIIDGRHLNDDKIEYLVEFRKQYQIPLICIAYQDDLSTRLKAIRVGASIFLRKPVESSYLTKIIDQFCKLSTKENFRILILDDSAALADYYSLILQEAGMTTRVVTNPMSLLQELDDFSPDLLLMDLYMPGCTGFELATILRQEERYLSLPIIFISTENDKFKQFATLSSGDDFLTKPVLPQHLIAAVKSRARRSAMLISYITHDSLTKLLNHTYILQQLESEIFRAQRQKQTITFAMIDLDHFKEVNDQHGHLAGDVVLKKIGEFLLARLRKTDFVGRYGGEEFAVIFPDTNVESAIKICDSIREKFSKHQFEANGNVFYVTLSIGISSYPSFQTVEEIVEKADNALYKAKSAGRNRIEYS